MDPTHHPSTLQLLLLKICSYLSDIRKKKRLDCIQIPCPPKISLVDTLISCKLLLIPQDRIIITQILHGCEMRLGMERGKQPSQQLLGLGV